MVIIIILVAILVMLMTAWMVSQYPRTPLSQFLLKTVGRCVCPNGDCVVGCEAKAGFRTGGKCTYDDTYDKLVNRNRNKFKYNWTGYDFSNPTPESNPKANETISADTVDEYGPNTIDYRDLITAENVSPEVIRNHQQFVRDRQQFSRQPSFPECNPEIMTIPWTGFARVSAVKIGDGARQTDEIYADQHNLGVNFTY